MQDAVPDASLQRLIRGEKDNLLAGLGIASTLPLSLESVQLEVELAVALAYLLVLPGDHAIATLSRASARAREMGATVQHAHVLSARQSIYALTGEFGASMRDLTELRELEGIPAGLRVLALVYRGILLRFEGMLHEALTNHRDARRELESLSLRRLSAMNDACMGRLMGDLGDPDAAWAENQRALDGADAMGDIWLGALALANLAQVEQERGDFDRAEELLERALGRLRAADEVQYVAIYSCVCGDLFFEMGRHDRARSWYEEGARFLGGSLEDRQAAFLHAALAALEAKEGDRIAASRHLDLAERSARRAGSPVVRVGVEIFRGVVELSRASDNQRAAVVERWSTRFAELGQWANTGGVIDVRFALRMLRRALDAAEGLRARPLLRVAHDASWFDTEDGGRVELGKRPSIRRVLAELVRHRRSAPGEGLGVDAMMRAAWPGERVLPSAASTPVRVAVSTLRRLGLRSLLVTREDGYLIDPAVRVELAAPHA